MKQIPKRLKKEPLLEAIWELRFSSDRESITELLPGLIYQAIGTIYPKVERLPAANLPPPVLQQDPALRYTPTIRMVGDPYSILIGEHVVTLSCRRPYKGWEEFKSKILELVKMLKDTQLLNKPERFSLKYIDIISFDNTITLEPLDVDLKIGSHELTSRPVHLRTEVSEDEFLHIIQIASPAEVKLTSGELFAGVLVDIDTIFQPSTKDFWSGFDDLLGKAHELSKNWFFNILKDVTIERLEPEY